MANPMIPGRRLSPAGILGAAMALSVIAAAILGPLAAPYAPTEFVGAPFDPPSSDALLGTDVLGRDVLSRLLGGGTQILSLAAVATVVGVGIGAFLGALAGYLKGFADSVIMRSLDIVMAFPQTILALLFVSIFGPAAWLIATIVAVIHTPQVARVARTVAAKVSEEDFVRYAESLGLPTSRIVMLEIMPSLTVPMLIELGLRFTYSIALVTGLGFLGLAADPSRPDWGMMISENRIGLFSNSWAVVAPVAMIAVLTVGTNVWADAVGKLRSRAPRAAEPLVDVATGASLGEARDLQPEAILRRPVGEAVR